MVDPIQSKTPFAPRASDPSATGPGAGRAAGLDALPVGSQAPAAPAGPARATVTSELRGVAADMATSPPVDAARVDALRAAISSGGYRIDPERIADAMIADARGKEPA